MTDTTAPAPAKKSIPKGAGNIWTDIGPVLVFVFAYNIVRRFPENNGLLSKENAIYWATGLFMASVAAAIGYTISRGRKLPPMLIITGVVVMVFGGLTLYLQDPKFAYYKPTIINLLFCVTILGSLAIGRNIWKTAFEHAFKLPDFAWRVFALRWAAFYAALAVLNEVIWRNFSEDFWSNSKLFLSIPLAIGFMLLNLPYLLRHSIEEPDAAAEADKPKDAA